MLRKVSMFAARLNAVTNIKIYKKSPVYYEAPDYKTAGGEIFLDRGYGAYDFFACNDTVSPNSFAVFKYTNRKNVKSPTDIERFNADFARLKSLVGERVRYRGRIFLPVSVQTVGDIFAPTCCFRRMNFIKAASPKKSIEHYNHKRMQTALNNMSPVQYRTHAN